jgi:hypothetical protein
MMRLNIQGAAEGRPLSLVAVMRRSGYLKEAGDDWVRQCRPREDLGGVHRARDARLGEEPLCRPLKVVPYLLERILSAGDC